MTIIDEITTFSALEAGHASGDTDEYFIFAGGNPDNVYQFRGKFGDKFTYRSPSNRLFKTTTDSKVKLVTGIGF